MKTQGAAEIVSTDIGIDDALALILLHRVGAAVDGIVATGGNVCAGQVADNCALLKDVFGWESPLFAGTDPPRPGPIRDATDVHGPCGLGDRKAPEAELPPLEQLEKRLSARRGELDLLVLGPATDVAAILRKPNLRRHVGRVLLMGGAFEPRAGRLGNVTEFAEFNVYMHPQAVNEMLGMGVPCHFVPLDCTEQFLFSADELTPPNTLSERRRVVAELIQYLREAHVRQGVGDGLYMHDVIAAAIWRGELNAKWKTAEGLEIVTSGPQRGRMKVGTGESPPVAWACGIERDEFLSLWLRAVDSL